MSNQKADIERTRKELSNAARAYGDSETADEFYCNLQKLEEAALCYAFARVFMANTEERETPVLTLIQEETNADNEPTD